MNDENENGNGNESKGVKMESRGKLGNDEKIKFAGPRKSVKLIEKVCGFHDIWKLPYPITSSNSISQF